MAFLMDSLTQIVALIHRQGDATHPLSRPYADLVRRLDGIPRFLLDDNAIAAAVELSLGRPKVLLEALAHCRVPYPAMWIEWREGARAKLHASLREFGIEEVPGRPVPDRIGFLIEAEHGGRRGTVTWAWLTNGLPPNVACITPHFNLDWRYEQLPILRRPFLRNNLVQLWGDNPVQLEALHQIWQTAEHKPTEMGERWLTAAASIDGRFSPARYDHLMEAGYADVFGEYIIIWAIMLLLTADRKPVAYRPIDRSKLNKVRRRKGEVPLLDHTEVVLHIAPRPLVPLALRGPLGHARKRPRLHMVSRYLGRRGDKYWIVEPYVRGTGGTISRHVKVRG